MKIDRVGLIDGILALLVISILITLICLLAIPGAADQPQQLIVEENFSSTEKIKPKKVFEISDDERDLLARLVYCEAGVNSDECKRAVISVVFNRLNSGKWGTSITEVIEYPCAFTPVLNGRIYTEEADSSCYEAVDFVLENGVTLPEEVRYFRDDYDFNWDGYNHYTTIDNMYFGYFIDWKTGAW